MLKVINIRIDNERLIPDTAHAGRELDHLTTRLSITIPEYLRGNYEIYRLLFYTRADNIGEAHITDPLSLDASNNALIYDIPSGLMVAGELRLQLRVLGAGDKVVHTAIGQLIVGESLGTITDEAGMPPNYAGLYEGKAEELQAVTDAARTATNEAVDATAMAEAAAGSAATAAEEARVATQAADQAAKAANQAAADISDALEAKADRQDTASVITGTATGEVAHLPEAAVGSRLRSVTVSGRTVATGTGEIGPQNPYTLSGVQPGYLSVTGINLINPVWVAGGVELQEDNRYYFDTSRSSRVYNMPCKLPAGTYTLSCRYQREQAIETAGVRLIVDGSTATYIGRGNDTEEHQLSYSFRIAAPTVIGIGVYTDPAALNVPRTPVWLSDVMLCVGAKAQPYTPYSGGVYAFPATTPFFGLPDGTADTYSNTGEQVIRIGSMALVPDMMWEVSARTNTTRFVSSVQTDILRESAYNAVLCNYLPTNEVYDDDVAGICLHEGRVVLSLPGSWDTTALYDWLAVPPGGAVTVYYPMAEPTTTQLDGITVTVPALDTYISAQGATVTAEYNKDTMAVIAALTARIAALEGGGVA